MNGHLITLDGTEHEPTEASLRDLLASSTGFWLDLCGSAGSGGSGGGAGERSAHAPGGSTHTILLRDVFGFHPLALEDAEHFGQRPKIDSYADFTLLVVYGASEAGELVEVHCFSAPGYLVTVHHQPCPELAVLGRRLRDRPRPAPDEIIVLHLVVDALVDGYFPVLAALDERIDELEDEILHRPTEAQLGKLFDMKRSLIAVRKVVTPQRDMFASLLSGSDVLVGMTADTERYFRDLYDHLIRISELVDSYRDLLSGVLDTHLSTVSNRLNVVMKQLTVIATIFLPLSFFTGFFGQNFGWMVNHLTSLPVFLGAGIGLQLVVVIGLLVLFRRRGWMTADGTSPAARAALRGGRSQHERWHGLGAISRGT